MKTVLILAVLALLFSTSTIEAKTPPVAEKTWSGTLADKMCAKKLKGDPAKAASHTKMCMTEEMCAKSGYGIIVGSTFYKFDTKGNELAATYLSQTAKEKDMQVIVSGTMSGSTIKVTNIKEKS